MEGMFSASSFYQLSTSIFLVMHKCAKILRNSSANVSKVRQKAIQICEHFISTRDNFITLMSPKTYNVDALFILRMLAFTCLYHCKMTIPTGSLIKLACICNSRSLTVIPPSTYNSDIGNPVSTSTPFIILINSHHTCNEE